MAVPSAPAPSRAKDLPHRAELERETVPTSGIGSTSIRHPQSSASPSGPKRKQSQSALSEASEERRKELAEQNQRELEAETRRVRETKENLDSEVERIKDDGNATLEAEQEKNRARIADAKQKGYEALRELQRRQHAELSRVKSEGEHDLETAKTYYRDKTSSTIQDGEKELTFNRNKKDLELEAIRTQGAREKQALESERNLQINLTKQQADAAMADSQRDQLAELGRIRTNGSLSITSANEKYQNSYQSQLNAHQASLQELGQASAQQLKQLRRDTTQKLNAYSNRQDDPFYRLMDTRANLSDEGEYYQLTARIPIHEQEKVKVDIRGNQLTLSGQRRNEEKLEIEPGRLRGTSAFQSFSETFPLTFPVDSKYLTKEFDGETLIARVPKLGTNAIVEQKRADSKEEVKRARIEKPDFPENLPLQPSPRGGRTLT